MMSDFDLAKRLFPRPADVVREATAGIPSTSQVRGYATSDSADGTVTVVLDAAAGGEDAEMEVPTMGGISEGSEVLVTLLDGTPVDCSQVGSIDAATATAVDAKAVADATAQHVWTDTNGLHVTEETREDWETNHSGANTLLNSLGQLFRDGINNLLALVSGSTPAVEIYDGQGNASSNIVARFASDLIELGDESAEIELCGDKGVIKYDSDKALPFQILGEENVFIGTSLRDGCNVSIVNSSNYKGISLYADEISLDGSTLSIFARSLGTAHDYDMADLVNALPVTLYDNASASASASATLSESAANFKRLTIMYRDGDGTHGSVEVWSPNGKRVALSLTWINGTATQSMYQRVRWVTISGTSIATAKNSSDAKYRTGQIQLGTSGSVDNSDYISITHVIGYR